MRHPLAQLLKSTDATLASSRSPRDLATIVRNRRAARRTARRVVFAAIALIAFSLLALSLNPRPRSIAHSTPASEHREDRDSLRTPLALIETGADLHELTARKLMQSRTPRRSAPKLQPSPEADLQYHRDRAALIIVYEADRVAKSDRPAAIASYRRAIELFPQTHWAGVARQRLKDIPS